MRKQTRAERNIAWIEDNCVIPEGKDVGKRVRLREWQKHELRKIYDNPHGTRTAIVSFGKKNAKTTLAAFLLLLHLSGPEAITNSQLVSTAQSRDQAAVLFELAAKIVRMSDTLSRLVSIRETVKQLYDPGFGTLYMALSADASTAHGKSSIFAVHDELGQVRGPRSELFTAIENAMGAHERPMSIVISTQAPTDADLLSILIDDAISGADPRVVISLYTAPLEMDPFSEEALRAANPAFGDFLNAQEVLGQAGQAKRMPSLESLYRNYTLNQRVEASSPFVTQSVWNQNGGAPEDGHILYCGLDLSETNDLTALVMVSAATGGKLSIKPVFFLPENEIGERARRDRFPYDVWARDGHICLTPGKSIAYQFVAQYLVAIFRTKDVRKIAFDRWNMKHLRPWLIREGLPESLIDDRFVEFGQGYQSMTPALRTLESLLLDAKLLHGNNPVLRMCAANAVVKSDEVGNRKLDKKRSRGRIDGMVALAMAVAMAYENLAVRPVFSVPTDRLVRVV
jgi:phage terminase large subunit-like protein